MTRKIRISNAERRARSDRRATIAAIVFILVVGLSMAGLGLMSALHHGHKAGLTTEDVLYGQ
jgi:hypothetical protein